jgi:hypothetical protein
MGPLTESAPTDGQAVTEQAQEKLKEGAEAAKEQALGVAQQAQARARAQIDQRTSEAGDRLKGSAGDVRSVAEHLRKEGKEGPAKLVEQAADRAESVGGYLSGADVDRLLRDVEQYARKNPWSVILGGLALGFAGSRIVSASSASRSMTAAESPQRPALGSGGAGESRVAGGAAAGPGYSNGSTEPPPANADLPNYGGSPT